MLGAVPAVWRVCVIVVGVEEPALIYKRPKTVFCLDFYHAFFNNYIIVSVNLLSNMKSPPPLQTSQPEFLYNI